MKSWIVAGIALALCLLYAVVGVTSSSASGQCLKASASDVLCKLSGKVQLSPPSTASSAVSIRGTTVKNGSRARVAKYGVAKIRFREGARCSLGSFRATTSILTRWGTLPGKKLALFYQESGKSYCRFPSKAGVEPFECSVQHGCPALVQASGDVVNTKQRPASRSQAGSADGDSDTIQFCSGSFDISSQGDGNFAHVYGSVDPGSYVEVTMVQINRAPSAPSSGGGSPGGQSADGSSSSNSNSVSESASQIVSGGHSSSSVTVVGTGDGSASASTSSNGINTEIVATSDSVGSSASFISVTVDTRYDDGPCADKRFSDLG